MAHTEVEVYSVAESRSIVKGFMYDQAAIDTYADLNDALYERFPVAKAAASLVIAASGREPGTDKILGIRRTHGNRILVANVVATDGGRVVLEELRKKGALTSEFIRSASLVVPGSSARRDTNLTIDREYGDVTPYCLSDEYRAAVDEYMELVTTPGQNSAKLHSATTKAERTAAFTTQQLGNHVTTIRTLADLLLQTTKEL